MSYGEIMSGVGLFIQTVGVPASIAFFILYRLDKTIGKMTDAMMNLSEVVKIMNVKMDDFFERRKGNSVIP